MTTVPSPTGVSPVQPRTSGLELSSLWTLFTLTLRQFLRGKRMLVIALLSLVPAGFAVLLRSIDDRHGATTPRELEFGILFFLVPHVLLPLTALLYGCGMILDEQEEQTLTYLLIRPLPKWALYLTKLMATTCMVWLLGLVFVVVSYLAIYVGSSQFLDVFPLKMLGTFGVMALALAAYAAVFGLLGLVVKWSTVVGVVYIAVIEGLLANLDFAVRKLTVNYYFRVLSLHWLNLDPKLSQEWSIQLGDAPGALACVLTLLFVIALTTFVATLVFSGREFYVKTPEGN
jgi:ABC-2 type transport system permease protein